MGNTGWDRDAAQADAAEERIAPDVNNAIGNIHVRQNLLTECSCPNADDRQAIGHVWDDDRIGSTSVGGYGERAVISRKSKLGLNINRRAQNQGRKEQQDSFHELSSDS